MRSRTVFEICDDRSRWMVTDRFIGKDKRISAIDSDNIEDRIQQIEINQSALENRRWVKPLKGTDGLFEIRLESNGKAIRIHCIKAGDDLIALNGYVKKNGSDQGMIAEAQRLKNDYLAGKLTTRELPNAQRI